MINFFSVTSAYYPELSSYYDEGAEEWFENFMREHPDEMEDL